MALKQKCPYCKNLMEYVKDEEAEELGFYGFDCKKCNEKFMTPKDSFLIIKE